MGQLPREHGRADGLRSARTREKRRGRYPEQRFPKPRSDHDAEPRYIVLVVVVCAAALAFIVLYNLTNINITERVREIATLKVLGFTPHEVNAYIYRETMLLSLIGAFVGLFLGIAMEGYVVITAEVDQVMFGREIHALSFIIAFALTMLFSVIVTLAMKFKLKKIDMVESLKSVD